MIGFWFQMGCCACKLLYEPEHLLDLVRTAIAFGSIRVSGMAEEIRPLFFGQLFVLKVTSEAVSKRMNRHPFDVDTRLS